MSINVGGGPRIIINDDFTEQLQSPTNPNVLLSDLNRNPATGQPSINPDDPLLKSATLTVGPNGQTGVLDWTVPNNVTVWWMEDDGEWVQVYDANNFTATGDPIDLLIEGVGIGSGNLSATFTPNGGNAGNDTEALTVYSPIVFTGPQAATLLQQVEAASGYDLTLDQATGSVYVNSEIVPAQLAGWQVQFRNYFYDIWANEDTTFNSGVTTIGTAETPNLFGSFDNQTVDTADFAAVIAVNAQWGSAILVHELYEEYDKQINNLPYLNDPGNDNSGGAHTDGIAAESAVIGLQRLSVTAAPDPNNKDAIDFVGTFGTPQNPTYLRFQMVFPNTTITNVTIGK